MHSLLNGLSSRYCLFLRPLSALTTPSQSLAAFQSVCLCVCVSLSYYLFTLSYAFNFQLNPPTPLLSFSLSTPSLYLSSISVFPLSLSAAFTFSDFLSSPPVTANQLHSIINNHLIFELITFIHNLMLHNYMCFQLYQKSNHVT